MAEIATPPITPSMPITQSIREDWLEALQRFAEEESFPSTGPEEGESLSAWVKKHKIPEEMAAKASASLLGIEFCPTIIERQPSSLYVQNFPIGFAREHATLALVEEDDSVLLALPSVESWAVLDTVTRLLGKPVKPLFVPRDEIQRAINTAYEQQSTPPDVVLDTMPEEDSASLLSAMEGRDDLLASGSNAPIVEMVNLVLLDAVKGGASDVHFQPYRDKLVIRYRIDGVLFDAHTFPKAVQEEATSRVKVMGDMNIAEKRLPQDGRATVSVGDRLIDLRIASLPGSYGERVVLRLLDKSAQLYSLAEIGMGLETRKTFRKLIDLEHGLILLTGPTGSGKSTTLYAALQEINTSDRNVVTLEDPVEYDIEGISQTQINVKKGLTFASGLRNVLRQDPDIIMVGEIRDHETAVMAVQSALTGHLVFSTLHTNDAASAVTRLLDLGIEPYLVSSSLLAVLAQRLVRKVCSKCKQEEQLTPDVAKRLGIAPEEAAEMVYQKGTGCASCRQTGYRGRVGICELLIADDPIRQNIQSHASATEIRDTAVEQGMSLLVEDGLAKIKEGTTTPSEVERVTVRASV